MAVTDLIVVVRQLLLLLLIISLPVLGVVFLSGLMTGLLSATTRFSDAAISISVRAVTVLLTVLWAAPWFGTRFAAFASQIWGRLIGITLQ